MDKTETPQQALKCRNFHHSRLSDSLPFPETNLAQGVWLLKEESQDLRQNGKAAKKETKRVSSPLFQVFDVPGDGGDGNRGGNCKEENDCNVG